VNWRAATIDTYEYVMLHLAALVLTIPVDTWRHVPIVPIDLVLVRLRLGLFERDLAKCFNISTSTVCRICRTWIRFIYLRFKELPLWLSWDLVNLYLPK